MRTPPKPKLGYPKMITCLYR